MKDVLLITPPFTQLNTPYPATAYLKGFLNTKGISSFQMDLGIEVINEIFKTNTFTLLFNDVIDSGLRLSENCKRILVLKEAYLQCLDDVILFLQGNNPTLARLICSENLLPQSSRFEQLDDLEWAFGNVSTQDKAKHLATLYLEDLSDFIKECIDDNFGFSRYAERLGQSANSFNQLYLELQNEPSYIDQVTLRLLEDRLIEINPKLVCISVPFPGNLFSAFRCAQYIKRNYPSIKICMGGGFPNTELRELKDNRVFEFFDFITLDDGELPIELLVSHCLSPANEDEFKRTFLVQNSEVVYVNNSEKSDYKQLDVGTPDYSDLPLDKYISVIEIANPMHSLWSDGRWNKLTMAHGCYWGKCTFCDISLDYIKLYEPVAAKVLVDRMQQLIAQTKETGFHFVDEAAPPSLMKALALEIIKRKLVVTWWTNIRFEKNFTYDLCQLLKASGCIAVSGGLEIASDRLLKLIDKGVTVEQVAQVTRNYTAANIMVHSYLMYGYPTQTEQETVDSLEMVRQLFEQGIIQSGFWHQFALTTHSPVGKDPEKFGVIPNYKTITFANNDVDFKDKTGIDHSKFSYGLRKSLLNYMHMFGFDYPLQDWFDFKVPKTSIPHDFIEKCLDSEQFYDLKPAHKIVWLGTSPVVKNSKGKLIELEFHTKTDSFQLNIEKQIGFWLSDQFAEIAKSQNKFVTVKEFRASYELKFESFMLFWHSEPIEVLKENGLLIV